MDRITALAHGEVLTHNHRADPRGQRTVMLVSALLIVLVAVVLNRPHPRTQVALRARVDAATIPSAAALLEVVPDVPLALGGLQLDGDASAAFTALGAPDQTFDDLFGPTHGWVLPGAHLSVSVWAGSTSVSALTARVAPGAATSIALHRGLLLGEATLGELLASWGAPARLATHPTDDYVVAYDHCIGEAPVIVKVDQAGPRGAAVPPALDAVVTGVVIAYADEPPGTGDCAP